MYITAWLYWDIIGWTAETRKTWENGVILSKNVDTSEDHVLSMGRVKWRYQCEYVSQTQLAPPPAILGRVPGHPWLHSELRPQKTLSQMNRQQPNITVDTFIYLKGAYRHTNDTHICMCVLCIKVRLFTSSVPWRSLKQSTHHWHICQVSASWFLLVKWNHSHSGQGPTPSSDH